jgi:hypothetical protein
LTAWLWEAAPDDYDDSDTFKTVWPWLKKAETDTNGRWPVEVTAERLRDGSLTGFFVKDAGEIICFAAIEVYDLNKTQIRCGNIVWCVAKRGTIKRWIGFFPYLLQWMKRRGCTQIEGQFRRGYERVLRDYGLKATHTVFEGAI